MIKNKKVKQLIPIVLMLLVVFVLKDSDKNNQDNSSDQKKYTDQTRAFENNKSIEYHYKSKASGVLLTFEATVENILSDDNEGSRHQRLILKVKNRTVLLAHNIDVAPRVPVNKYDKITVRGEYEWNQKGGIVHWTHKKDNSPYGWVQFNNKKYQ